MLTAKTIVYLKGNGTWDNAYDTLIDTFPAVLVARQFHFAAEPFFDVDPVVLDEWVVEESVGDERHDSATRGTRPSRRTPRASARNGARPRRDGCAP